MQVIFYNNRSDNRKLSKSITELSRTDCQLKDNCSLINPILLVSHSALSLYNQCNYMYIPEFGRYYYCELSAMTGDMIEVHGKVDVLMSHAANIRALQCTILRQQNKFNPYIVDPFIPSRAQRNIQRVSVGTYNAGTGLYLTVDGGKVNGTE